MQPARLELRLSVPRWQKAVSWAFCGLFLAIATLAARADWERGVQGFSLWAPYLVRLVQGLLLQQVVWNLDAKVLQVEDGVLTVTTRFRRPFGAPRFQVPVGEAALEWIGGRLVLQTPEDGGSLRLGHAPAARGTAEWLMARGVRPPVGG